VRRAGSARAGTTIDQRLVTSKRSPSAEAIRVRVVSPGDEEKLRRMVCRLSRETIYRRFHAPYPRVPGWVLSRLAEAGRYDGESLVAIVGDEIVGHAMYVRVDNGREAEVSLSAEDAWQPKGIGKLLLTEIAEEARGRGVEAFTGMLLGENRHALGFLEASTGVCYEVKRSLYLLRAPLGKRAAAGGGHEREGVVEAEVTSKTPG
jgi:GNAT superfamily N-acetyltransferase